MERLSRAGREMQFLRILKQQMLRMDDRWMTTGMVTRRAGLKSSTRFKTMLYEMALSHDNVMWRDDRGKMEFAFYPSVQMPLPDRTIVINGRNHKVADWVYR